MRATLRKWILVGLCLFSLSALSACGGDGGGGGSGDSDGDGIVNSADNCPTVANPDQADSDGDGVGNVCEAGGADTDGDGVADSTDNCPANINPDQADTDGDGVGNVCDATPQADVFNWTGNTRLTVIASAGLLANDPPGSVITAASTTTTLGGTVNVTLTTGAFTYDPPVGVPAGVPSVNDTFTYTVNGEPATVTINLTERIWYVDNSLPTNGNGTLASPFNTLVQAATASDANDTLFVFTGIPLAPTDAGQNGGIVLKDGQKLIGQGVGLDFNGLPLVPRRPNNPVISNTALVGGGGNIPVVQLASSNEVAGLTITAAVNEGILALGGSGHNLHDNAINITAGTGREGIRLLSVTGSNFVTSNTITGAQRDGIKFVNNEDVAGNTLVTPTLIVATVTMSRNTITTSAQDGIAVILDGSGTAVTLNILTNTITGSAANEGINIDSLGAAGITTVLSRNTISNSTQEAIDLSANAIIKAFVANNDLSLSSGAFRNFRAANATGSGNICLELINNKNVTVNSDFEVDNGAIGTFSFFERDNNTLAVRAPANLITNVVEGACAIPLDGAALFVANCAVCHTGNGINRLVKNELIARDITNRTAAQINAQFAPPGNLSMIEQFNLYGRLTLTPQEIQAIAAALVAAP